MCDETGAPLGDGHYRWQLTVRRTLTAAEQSAMTATTDAAERMRADAAAMRRAGSVGDHGGLSSSDPDGSRNSEVDERQIEAADRAAERAEMHVETLRRDLEEQNGRFAVIDSGSFEAFAGTVTFENGMPRQPAGANPEDVGRFGMKLSGDDSAGDALSTSTADELFVTTDPDPSLKTYFADDVETAGGICANCANGSNPAVGMIDGDYFYSTSPFPFVYFDQDDASSAWLIGNYFSDNFLIVDWDNGNTPVVSVEETAPANTLYLDSTGNIGNRQTVPLTDLHITEFNPEVRFEDSSDSTYADVGYDASYFHVQGNTGQNAVRVAGAAPEDSIFVKPDGDIGLGSDPDSFWGFVDLQIDGRELVYSQTLHLATGGWALEETGAGFYKLVVSPVENISTWTWPFVVNLAAPFDLLNLTPTGVAIKGTSSAATLHVYESDAALHGRVMTRLEGANFEPQFEYTNASTGKTWRLGSNPSGQFVINQTDDLGIAEMLITPDGIVRVNGTQVHPDYVFKPGYELMGLPELKEFVSANGHLPGVVSSEQANGTIELTSLPLQMLEKIEELALYTIEQHEQITSQQAIIDDQRRENEALRAEMETRLAAIEARLAEVDSTR